MTLREKIIFLLALEWAHAEQKAAPDITIQEAKVKIGEQFLKEYENDGLRIRTMWPLVRDEVTKDIEKAAKAYKRKIIGIEVAKTMPRRIR